MALSTCLPVSTNETGKELIDHGSSIFPVACYHDNLRETPVSWHWHEELEALVVEKG